jgi:hypothetical protein
MVVGIRGLLAALLALLLVPPGEASSLPRDLFVIERSKSASIVVYDANRGPIKRQELRTCAGRCAIRLDRLACPIDSVPWYGFYTQS